MHADLDVELEPDSVPTPENGFEPTAAQVHEWIISALSVNEVLYPPPPSPAAVFLHHSPTSAAGSDRESENPMEHGLGREPSDAKGKFSRGRPSRTILTQHDRADEGRAETKFPRVDYKDERDRGIHEQGARSIAQGLPDASSRKEKAKGGADWDPEVTVTMTGGADNSSIHSALTSSPGIENTPRGQQESCSPGTKRMPRPRSVNCVSRQTVLVVEEENPSGPLRDLNVSHCTDAHLYLLEPYRFVTIMGCSDCTIVVGAVQSMLQIIGSERIQLVAACRRLYISSCVESVFPIFTTTHPILAGDNRACQFAPYNTAYQNLPAHLRAANLPTASPPAVNFWNCPIDVNTMTLPVYGSAAVAANPSATSTALVPASVGDQPSPPRSAAVVQHQRSPPGAGSPSGGVKSMSPGTGVTGSQRLLEVSRSPVMLPPVQFYTLTVPGPSRSFADPIERFHNPFALPSEYALVLGHRKANVRDIQGLLEGQDLLPSQQQLVEEAVRAHFGEWLVSSGNLRQVLDLVQLDRECALQSEGGAVMSPVHP